MERWSGWVAKRETHEIELDDHKVFVELDHGHSLLGVTFEQPATPVAVLAAHA